MANNHYRPRRAGPPIVHSAEFYERVMPDRTVRSNADLKVAIAALRTIGWHEPWDAIQTRDYLSAHPETRANPRVHALGLLRLRRDMGNGPPEVNCEPTGIAVAVTVGHLLWRVAVGSAICDGLNRVTPSFDDWMVEWLNGCDDIDHFGRHLLYDANSECGPLLSRIDRALLRALWSNSDAWATC